MLAELRTMLSKWLRLVDGAHPLFDQSSREAEPATGAHLRQEGRHQRAAAFEHHGQVRGAEAAIVEQVATEMGPGVLAHLEHRKGE